MLPHHRTPSTRVLAARLGPALSAGLAGVVMVGCGGDSTTAPPVLPAEVPLQQLWAVPQAGQTTEAARPAAAGDMVLFSANLDNTNENGGVIARDRATGAVRWQTRTGEGAPIALRTQGSTVIAVDLNLVTALNAATGAVLWTRTPVAATASTTSGPTYVA